jgi:molecular chaperone GrpE (heat shock protein)
MGIFTKGKVDAEEPARVALDESDSGPQADDVEQIMPTPEVEPVPEVVTAEPIGSPPVPPPDDAVLEAVSALAAKVDQLADRDDRENRMYEDLRKLREGDDVVRSLPLFRSVIQVIDRVHELQRGDHDLAAALPQIEEELVELLERYGIEQIERSVSDGFDASLQKAIGQLGADCPDPLEIVGAGNTYGDRIIRHQHVMVRPADRPPAADEADQPLHTEP